MKRFHRAAAAITMGSQLGWSRSSSQGRCSVSFRRLRLPLLLTAATFAAGAPSLSAQVIRGTVVDAATGDAVAAAYVAILDTGGVAVGGGATGADGRFLLRVPGRGLYRFRASRLGYDGLLTEAVDVGPSADVPLLLRLRTSPVEIPSITVEANRHVARLEDVGFYRRRAMGFGHFLTPEQIEARVALRVTDLLRNLAGVRVVGGELDVMMPGAEAMFIRGGCFPSIVLDGYVVRVGGIPSRGWMWLKDLLNPAEIEALEVYPSAAGVPAQAAGYVSPCGAIVAWTKR